MCSAPTWLGRTLKVTVLRAEGNLFAWTKTHTGEQENGRMTGKQAELAKSRTGWLEGSEGIQIWGLLNHSLLTSPL